MVPSLPSTVEMILMSLFRSAVMMLMAVALKNCKPTGAVFKRCFWLTARDVNRECPVLQLRRPVSVVGNRDLGWLPLGAARGLE